jgi:hypothetical protein
VTAAVAPALAALGPEWFGEVLGADVETVTIERVALSGATTDMARVHLTYSGGAAGPPTVITKITGTDEVRAGMDAAMGLFAREGRFYREFADEVPVRSPRCHHVGDGSRTPLVLEDLAGLRAGDQIEGVAVADAERVIDSIAQLHARFWEAPELSGDWLVQPAEGPFAAMVAQLVGSGVEALQQGFAEQAPPGVLDAVAEHAPDWGAVIAKGTEGPHTLVHGDCRLDNIFFGADGEPVLIDWQIPADTRGTQDVAYLLAQSMDPGLLDANWEQLLRRYHERLGEHGVGGYSWDQCLTHYRQNVPYALGAGMALLGAMDIGDGRGLGEAIVSRTLRHIGAIDAFGAL